MIKFFRNIRRSLLGEGKSARYFKYAVGEILLVMIGILLALQVNNWNENRKAKQHEIKLASQLLDDARADSIFFETRVNFQKVRDTLFNHLIYFSNNRTSDSIAKKPVNADPFFFRLAYQSNLISNNPDAYDIITNDTIKSKLREYKARYDYVVHSIELSNRIIEEYGFPLQIKYYEELKLLSGNVTIKDFAFIVDDMETIALIEQFKSYGFNYLFQLERFLTSNQELIQLLEEYLNNNKRNN